jgi:DNA-binding transcriptional regulator YiaG
MKLKDSFEIPLDEALILFGRKIASLRKSQNFSQQKFAELCGWDMTRQSRVYRQT